MAEKKRKKTSLGWFFWVAFILLVALLFFINKNNIKAVFQKTNADKIFKTSETTEEEQNQVDISVISDEIEKINSEESNNENVESDKSKKKNTKAVKASKKSNTKKESKKDKKKDTKKKDNKEKISKKTKSNKENKETAKEKKSKEKSKHNKPKDVKKENNKKTPVAKETKKGKKQATNTNEKSKMNAKLFFIKVGADGQIIRKAVSRKVPKTDSPMSTVLRTLLQGASVNEAKQGLRSFIPPNTRLLSATVKDGIAILNLSEEFQFNQYGIEAYQEQLAQIVFTACEFPTVNSVQFLIEGERKNYLGGEGVWIGAPLTPASF